MLIALLCESELKLADDTIETILDKVGSILFIMTILKPTLAPDDINKFHKKKLNSFSLARVLLNKIFLSHYTFLPLSPIRSKRNQIGPF